MILGDYKLFEKFVIGPPADPLLVRYILFRTPAIGFFLHHMKRSDYDRALHDHPWPFVSFVLHGGYFEVHDQTLDGQQVREWRGPGSVLVRPAEWRHRFELVTKSSLTLVVVGRRSRKWGFFLPEGWCWWRKHNAEAGVCEEDILHFGGKD